MQVTALNIQSMNAVYSRCSISGSVIASGEDRSAAERNYLDPRHYFFH